MSKSNDDARTSVTNQSARLFLLENAVLDPSWARLGVFVWNCLICIYT